MHCTCQICFLLVLHFVCSIAFVLSILYCIAYNFYSCCCFIICVYVWYMPLDIYLLTDLLKFDPICGLWPSKGDIRNDQDELWQGSHILCFNFQLVTESQAQQFKIWKCRYHAGFATNELSLFTISGLFCYYVQFISAVWVCNSLTFPSQSNGLQCSGVTGVT